MTRNGKTKTKIAQNAFQREFLSLEESQEESSYLMIITLPQKQKSNISKHIQMFLI